MKAFQAEFRVSTMARVLGVSRQGFYAWCRREPSQRATTDVLLLAEIRRLHQASRGLYGACRIHAQLRRGGWRVGKKRVARLMIQAGIRGVMRQGYKPTTVRNKRDRPAPDLVNRAFHAEAPDLLWVADITEIPTRSGKLYLATVLDVFSRRIVGFAMDTHMESTLAQRALQEALTARKPSQVIHHSDQGSQYTAKAFRELAAATDVQVSMGSVGDCYDNAMAESFFATLEHELLRLKTFWTPEQARKEVFDFIAGFYNTSRLHSQIGYRTPAEMDALHQSMRAAA